MDMVLPAWLDQTPKLSFEPEKELLTQMATWAQELVASSGGLAQRHG